jgi:hypothetical protein
MTLDVEAILARHTVRRAAIVGPAVIAVLWVTRGAGGGVAAAVGVGLIVMNFLLSGMALSAAARISLSLYHAAALFGFLLRLLLITGVMMVVARLFDIDRIAFGAAAVATYLVLLVLEAVAVARGTEGELEWTS